MIAPLLSTLLLAGSPQVTDGAKLIDGLPAPALEADEWIGTPPDQADLHGRPFAVHSIVWDDPRSKEEFVPVFGELLDANQDLGFRCVAFARAIDPERARTELESMGIDYPVGLVQAEEHPYLDVNGQGEHVAAMVGPSGEVVWIGDPLRGSANFSAHVQETLRRHALPAWTDATPRRLHDLLSAYLSGRLRGAIKLASRLHTAQPEGSELGVLAARMEEAATRAIELWMEQAAAAVEVGDAYAFVRVARVLRKGAETDEVKQGLGKLERRLRRTSASALAAATAWDNLQVRRPALFPARLTDTGERYLLKLEAFLEAYPEGPEHRAAQELIVRYRRLK